VTTRTEPPTLCRLDELPDGESRGFDPTGSGRDTLFIVRQGLQRHAWRNACPHMAGAPMAWRKDAYLSGDLSRIVCYAHGAQFDIRSGECLLGPCLGQHLTPVAVQLTAEGDVVLVEPPH
jgi:nitrite reductase/ring-hydroxylating ferredoxin subunit